MNFPVKPVILAVDDDPIILNTVLSTLKASYKIIPLTSAKAALKYLEENVADLILLDYHMPEMSGFEMLEVLLADSKYREIPVIFLTGSMDGDGEASALLMGAVDYITKPIRPQVLTTRISLQLELINHRKHLEQLVTEKTKGLSEALDLLRLREDVTLNLLARVTELRDSDTGTHIERTTEFVRLIVTDLLENPVDGYEVTKEQATDIIKSAQLHDLGKIAVPDSILLKPDKLTPEEFDIIKTHTSEGKKLLSDTVESMKTAETRHIKDDEGNRIIKLDSFLATARDITYSHHEKWNGNGYPQGLAGADIPLAARIVALSDVYDALTSARPYKEAFSHEKSASIIYEDSGKHFDPYLVEVFKRHEKEFEEISKWSPRLHI